MNFHGCIGYHSTHMAVNGLNSSIVRLLCWIILPLSPCWCSYTPISPYTLYAIAHRTFTWAAALFEAQLQLHPAQKYNMLVCQYFACSVHSIPLIHASGVPPGVQCDR